MKKRKAFNENGCSYAYFKEDSYAMKDKLKAAGFLWEKTFKCWMTPDKENEFSDSCVEITRDDLLEWTEFDGKQIQLPKANWIEIFQAKIKAARPQVEESNSEYMFEVGKRIKKEKMTLVSIRQIDGMYGTSYLHTFKIGDNILTWFTATGRKGMAGAEYLVSATVKEHKEYKGTKQTMLTRCTLEEGELN